MLSKRKLVENYKELVNYQIIKDSSQPKFANSYMEKAFHNLEVAGILDLVSRGELEGIKPGKRYYDWVIITSYYSMYMASTAAIAKQKLKSTSHKATTIALEYWYCVERNLLNTKRIKKVQEAGFSREDIISMNKAMKGREAVQYTISEKHNEKLAKDILYNAKIFVNKINIMLKEE